MIPPTTRGVRCFAGALICIMAACGGDQSSGAAQTITRDVFVGTYVELRMAGLRSPDGRISPSAKQEILETKGVTEAELLEFVNAHAPRVQFMVDVWAQIDDTLRVLRTEEANPAS